MKNTFSKFVPFAWLLVTALLLSGCNSIQPVLVMSIGDFLGILLFDLLLMLVLALYMSGAFSNDASTSSTKFWVWFVLGVFLPPVLIIASILKAIFNKK